MGVLWLGRTLWTRGVKRPVCSRWWLWLFGQGSTNNYRVEWMSGYSVMQVMVDASGG